MTHNNQHHGFSLIELIGVLAIMSILASIIIPNMVKRIDLANADAEATQLTLLTTELEQYIKTRFIVPSENTWAAAIASVSSLPLDAVSTNKNGFSRGFYVDPQFFTTVDKAFVEYKQTTGLLTSPVHPRIMLVSNLKSNAPSAPATSAAFNAIWNQTTSTSLVEGDDIKIHRLYVGHLFHHVLLLNSSNASPFYKLENNTAVALPPAVASINGQLSIYILHRTQLTLHQEPYPTGARQYTLFIQEQDSLLYGSDGVSWFWGRP